MKVKDTYLSAAIAGDVGMRTARGLFKGDVMGEVIVIGSGNQGKDEDGDGIKEPGRSSGRYTHCFFVVRPPDPEAEVIPIKTNKAGRIIYKVKDKKLAGLKIHATWPCVKEQPIDWESDNFELWRVRSISRKYWILRKSLGIGCYPNQYLPEEVFRILKWTKKRIGRVYNWLQFISFGLFHLPNSWVCSHFIFDGCLDATRFDEEPIVLSPDGKFDSLPTPNDLINSLKMIRVRYDGELNRSV